MLNSSYSSDSTKKIIAIEKVLRSYKYLLTPNNLIQSSLWREQGTLSAELIFVWRSLSCIFLEHTDFLIPLSDSEQHLAEALLQQPDKMVSTEEAIKRMEEWAKKKRKGKPTTS